MVHFHAGYCRWGYLKVQEFRMRNVTAEMLYQYCGYPFYWELIGIKGEPPHWEGKYTDGVGVASFVLNEDGTVSLYGTTSLLMDSL